MRAGGPSEPEIRRYRRLSWCRSQSDPGSDRRSISAKRNEKYCDVSLRGLSFHGYLPSTGHANFSFLLPNAAAWFISATAEEAQEEKLRTHHVRMCENPLTMIMSGTTRCPIDIPQLFEAAQEGASFSRSTAITIIWMRMRSGGCISDVRFCVNSDAHAVRSDRPDGSCGREAITKGRDRSGQGHQRQLRR